MLDETKEQEFRQLFLEFSNTFLKSSVGQEHLRSYDEVRARGLANLNQIVSRASVAGKDVTDDVLRGLLPHTNSAAHRASGAWIHVAPAIQADIRTWFESANWISEQQWPMIAQEILVLLLACSDDASSLEDALKRFSRHGFRGFQTGMISPILNALNPDRFLIVNNKSRKAINYFTSNAFKQPLSNYADINEAGLLLVKQLALPMREISGSSARPSDLFDIFCHWLTAVKKYPPVVDFSPGKKIRIEDREVIVAVPNNEDEEEDSPIDPRPSYVVQAALAHLGTKMGMHIWVPKSDRQKILSLVPPAKHSLFLRELPLGYDDIAIKTIEQIDVIWIKKRAIVRAFEVEHTTSIYSGLLRMTDLLALIPNMDIRLHIAAPIERKAKVRQEIRRPTFSLLERKPLYQMCSFLSYSAVEELNSLEHLELLGPAVLDKYDEQFEESEI